MYLSIRLVPDFDNDRYTPQELLYQLVYADGQVLATDLDAQVALQLREDCCHLARSEATDFVARWCESHQRHDPQLIAARDARISRELCAEQIRAINQRSFANFRASRLRESLGPHVDYLDLLRPASEGQLLSVTLPKHRSSSTPQFFLSFK